MVSVLSGYWERVVSGSSISSWGARTRDRRHSLWRDVLAAFVGLAEAVTPTLAMCPTPNHHTASRVGQTAPSRTGPHGPCLSSQPLPLRSPPKSFPLPVSVGMAPPRVGKIYQIHCSSCALCKTQCALHFTCIRLPPLFKSRSILWTSPGSRGATPVEPNSKICQVTRTLTANFEARFPRKSVHDSVPTDSRSKIYLLENFLLMRELIRSRSKIKNYPWESTLKPNRHCSYKWYRIFCNQKFVFA